MQQSHSTNSYPIAGASLDQGAASAWLSWAKQELCSWTELPGWDKELATCFDRERIEKVEQRLANFLVGHEQPELHWSSRDALTGADGALVDGGNEILIARDLLDGQHAPDIARVLLEEIGHWLDGAAGSGDSRGDEGQKLASQLGYEDPLRSDAEVDDHGQLSDGRAAEFSGVGSTTSVEGWSIQNPVCIDNKGDIELWKGTPQQAPKSKEFGGSVGFDDESPIFWLKDKRTNQLVLLKENDSRGVFERPFQDDHWTWVYDSNDEPSEDEPIGIEELDAATGEFGLVIQSRFDGKTVWTSRWISPEGVVDWSRETFSTTRHTETWLGQSLAGDSTKIGLNDLVEGSNIWAVASDRSTQDNQKLYQDDEGALYFKDGAGKWVPFIGLRDTHESDENDSEFDQRFQHRSSQRLYADSFYSANNYEKIKDSEGNLENGDEEGDSRWSHFVPTAGALYNDYYHLAFLDLNSSKASGRNFYSTVSTRAGRTLLVDMSPGVLDDTFSSSALGNAEVPFAQDIDGDGKVGESLAGLRKISTYPTLDGLGSKSINTNSDGLTLWKTSNEGIVIGTAKADGSISYTPIRVRSGALLSVDRVVSYSWKDNEGSSEGRGSTEVYVNGLAKLEGMQGWRLAVRGVERSEHTDDGISWHTNTTKNNLFIDIDATGLIVEGGVRFDGVGLQEKLFQADLGEDGFIGIKEIGVSTDTSSSDGAHLCVDQQDGSVYIITATTDPNPKAYIPILERDRQSVHKDQRYTGSSDEDSSAVIAVEGDTNSGFTLIKSESSEDELGDREERYHAYSIDKTGMIAQNYWDIYLPSWEKSLNQDLDGDNAIGPHLSLSETDTTGPRLSKDDGGHWYLVDSDRNTTELSDEWGYTNSIAYLNTYSGGVSSKTPWAVNETNETGKFELISLLTNKSYDGTGKITGEWKSTESSTITVQTRNGRHLATVATNWQAVAPSDELLERQFRTDLNGDGLAGRFEKAKLQKLFSIADSDGLSLWRGINENAYRLYISGGENGDEAYRVRDEYNTFSQDIAIQLAQQTSDIAIEKIISPTEWVERYLCGAMKNANGEGYTLLARIENSERQYVYRMISLDAGGRQTSQGNLYWQQATQAIEEAFARDLNGDQRIGVDPKQLQSIWVRKPSNSDEGLPQPLQLGENPSEETVEQHRRVVSESGGEILGMSDQTRENRQFLSDGWYLKNHAGEIAQLRDFYGRPLTTAETSWSMPYLIRDLPYGGYEVAWQRLREWVNRDDKYIPVYEWAFATFDQTGIATTNKKLEFSTITSRKEIAFDFDFNQDGRIGSVDPGSLKVISLENSPVTLWVDSENALYLGTKGSRSPSISVTDREGAASSLRYWDRAPVAARWVTDENGNTGYEVVLQAAWETTRSGLTVFLDAQGVINALNSDGTNVHKWYSDLVALENSYGIDLNGDASVGYSFNQANSVESRGDLALWADEKNHILYFGKNAESILPIKGWNGTWFRYDKGEWSDYLGRKTLSQFEGIELNGKGRATYVYRQTITSGNNSENTWYSFDVDLTTGREISGSWSQTQRPEKLESLLDQDLNGDGKVGLVAGRKDFVQTDSPATRDSSSQQFLIREVFDSSSQADGYWISANNQLGDEDDQRIVDWQGNTATIDRSWNGSTVIPIAVEKEQWGIGYQLIGQQGANLVLAWLWKNSSVEQGAANPYYFGGWSETISLSDKRIISAIENRFRQDLDGNGVVGGFTIFDPTSAILIMPPSEIKYPEEGNRLNLYRDGNNVYAFTPKTSSTLPQQFKTITTSSGIPAELGSASDTDSFSLRQTVECILPATGEYATGEAVAILLTKEEIKLKSSGQTVTTWQTREINSAGVLIKSSLKTFASIPELEEAIEIDLNNDRKIGVPSADLSEVDLYEVSSDDYVVLLENPVDHSLWISRNDLAPQRITNANGSNPSFRDIISLAGSSDDVKIKPIAITVLDSGQTNQYQVALEYSSRISHFFRTFQVDKTGVIDWSTEGYSTAGSGLERIFNQDINGDGNITSVSASNALAVASDISTTGGSLLKDQDSDIYWIRKSTSDTQPTLISLQDGTPPALDNSGKFRTIQYESKPFLIERQADGTYLLLIRDEERDSVSGTSSISWQSLCIQEDGIIDPASIRFDSSESIDETKFGQDLNGDQKITTSGIAQSSVNSAVKPSIGLASDQGSNIVAVKSSNSEEVVNLYVSTNGATDSTATLINASILKQATPGMVAQALNDNQLANTEATALTGLIDFDVTIKDPNLFGSIVQVNFSLPQGETYANYIKLDPVSRRYIKLDFDPLTGEGAKVEDGVLKVFIRDNGKYDDDNRLGYVKDPAFLAKLSLKAPEQENNRNNGGHEISGNSPSTTEPKTQSPTPPPIASAAPTQTVDATPSKKASKSRKQKPIKTKQPKIKIKKTKSRKSK